MASNNSEGAPSIRTFQFDGDAVGIIKNSVNMFRGDVNFSLDLITLTGRNQLDVKITALCQSNIHNDVTSWNLNSPTSILGLGWTLAGQKIVADTKGNGSGIDNQYYYSGGDSMELLDESDIPWLKLTLDNKYITVLNSGAVSEEIQAVFAESGILLSLDSNVVIIENSKKWKVIDKVYEYTYNIEADTDMLNVYDGGTGYQKQSYQFWKICYYKEFEKWEITNETGIISVFGGKVSTDANGYSSSEGNSIEWGVKWGNWTGTSKVSHNSEGDLIQQQYPVAWNTSETRNIWDDKVIFEYEQVTQLVGENGLPYTKACYLKKISDVFERTVELVYDNKEYTLNTPSGAREYLSPHHNDPYTVMPDDSPAAFQDRYQTKYLERINVYGRSGELLMYIKPEYTLNNYSDYDTDNFLYGDTTKRMLKSITQYNSQGDSLPGMEFEYCAKEEQNKGAIKVITYPEGGKGIYTYSEGDLPVCSRSVTIDNPWNAGDSVPRVWFGTDYVVNAWYNENESKLKISVYTWLGRWELWEPEESVISTSVDIDSLQVIAQKDFFVLSYKYASVTYVRLFHKNDRFWGKWFESPENPVKHNTAYVTFASGESFVVMNDRDNNEITRYTWNWKTKLWIKELITQGNGLCEGGTGSIQYFITGASNFYSVLCYDKSSSGVKKNRMQLFYLDGKNQWHSGGVINPVFTIAGADINSNFSWSSGSSMIAATYTKDNQSSYFEYEIRIFQWDENYENITESFRKYTLKKSMPSGSVTVPYVGNISLNSMITSGPYAQRYNGAQWLANDELALITDPTDETIYWFAAGNDYLLKTENNPYKVIEAMLVFDPNTQSEKWDTGYHLLLDTNDPVDNRKRHYFPTAGQNSFSFDRDIYFRGTSTNWDSSIQEPAYSIPGEIDTTTMVNQAPEFFIYLLYIDDKPASTDVLILKNDTVSNTEHSQQRFFQSIDPDGNFAANIGGKYPAGNSSFFTFLPLDKTINYAGSITIHRFVNNSIEKNIKDYSVKNIKISDGYNEYYTSYKFYRESAICDPGGNIVKYYRSASYPGCETPEESSEGWTEQFYLNGLDPKHEAINNMALLSMENAGQNYNVLDGLMYQKIIYDSDGNEAENSTYDWGICISVESNGRIYEIRGAYIKLNNVVSTKNKVTQNTWYSYDKISGQQISQAVDNYNSEGRPELITDETTFGYSAYEWLLRKNILTPVVQTTTKSKVENDDEIVTSTQVETWNPFPRVTSSGINIQLYASHKTYLWNGGEESPVFDFTLWSGNSNPPKAWLKTSEILERSNNGLMLESSNVMDLISSSIYDKYGELEVAGFSNSSVKAQQASYYGFEDYESLQGWEIDTSVTPVISGDAMTGKNSLKIPGQTVKGPAKKITLTSISQKYIFTSWLKTEEGFGRVTNSAGWKIKITSGTTWLKEIFVDFMDTFFQWQYLSTIIDLRDFDMYPYVEIEFVAVNNNNKYALIDSIRFSPFECEYSANVYNFQTKLPIATLGTSSQVSRIIYDSFQRKKADTGPAESLNTIDTSYDSRSGNNNLFNPSDPNSAISVVSMESGFYSRFNNGTNWKLHWESEKISDWSVRDDMIVYTGSGKGFLSLRDPEILSDYSMYLNLYPYGVVNNNIGINIGEDLTIEWEVSSKRWKMTDHLNGVSLTSSYVSQQPEKELLLVLTPEMLFFYANGKQLFNCRMLQTPKGKFTLFTSDKTGFYNILFARKPALTASFIDGTGKPVQTHSLIDISASIGQTVYDNIGREAVTTKSALIVSTDEEPIMKYMPGFVTSLNWISGEMEGEINEYFPEDEKYPYTRTLFERSPLGRTIERGSPGKEYAIVDLDTTLPEDRHTSKISYSSNTNDTFPEQLNLPEGEYFLTIQTDQNGVISKSIIDKNETGIASGTLTEEGVYVLTAISIINNKSGKTITTKLPNYFTALPDEKENWTTVQNYSIRELLTQIRQTDSGTGKIIYDKAGSPRFSQDALGEKGGYILYNKYDVQGRAIEGGWLEFEWNEMVLQEYADEDARWPSYTQPHTVSKIMTYDGDGTDPLLIGQLTEAVSINAMDINNETEVREKYGYNAAGAVTVRTIRAAGYDAEEYKFVYDYDNAGNIIKLTYPALNGQPGMEVNYAYNRLGQNTEVGDSSDSKLYASYNYNSSGSVQSEILGAGSVNEIVTGFQYNSPGWLISKKNKFLEETLDYKNGYENSAYYDGKIARASFKIEPGQNSSPGFLKEYSYGYSYSNTGYLKTADNNKNPDYSLGVEIPVTYDHNGNIKTLTIGNNDAQYEYYTATDKVKNTLGSSAEEYTYNDLGNLTSSLPKKITSIVYDRFSQMTASMNKQGDSESLNLKIQYNGSNRRTLKESGNSVKLYLAGSEGASLVEKLKTGGIESETVFFIYGPIGLIKIIKNGTGYNLIKDHGNSTRALIDPSGVLSAAYNYLPFGGFMGESYEAERITDYLFSGQELEGYTAGGIHFLGLYNYKARFYDYELGRFYSTDPSGQFASPYIYCGNNPVSFIDPNGEISVSSAIGLAIGVALIVAGAILTVATLGAATPAMVGLSVLGTTLIAGGIAGTIYSATHTREGEFKWGAFIGTVAVASVLAAATAGVGIGVGALGASAFTTFAVEAIAGTAFGAVDGYVMNGFLTGVWTGKQAGYSALFGGIAGGVVGGIGGFLGRGVNVRNANILKSAKGGRGAALAVGEHGGVGPINHSVSGIRPQKKYRFKFYDLVEDVEDDLRYKDVIKGGMPTLFQKYADYNPQQARTYAALIPDANADSASRFISRNINKAQGDFNMFTNGCTVWTKKVVRSAGLEPPLWAQTSTSLTFWFRRLGAVRM